MTELSLRSINETLAGGMKPGDENQDIKVVGHSEAGLLKHSEMTKGETLLANTLELIELKLRMKVSETRAIKLIKKLRLDKIRLIELKADLLKNVDEHQGDDKREEMAEQVVKELLLQSL